MFSDFPVKRILGNLKVKLDKVETDGAISIPLEASESLKLGSRHVLVNESLLCQVACVQHVVDEVQQLGDDHQVVIDFAEFRGKQTRADSQQQG